MTIHDRLTPYSNPKYRDFQSKLVPNIPKDTILGVKTPDLRRIAKDLRGTGEGAAFLASLPHEYYEENLVHFFLIGELRDFDECVRAVETFLPYVDCWPVCDQSSPKAFRKNREKLLPLIQKWMASDHVYTVRFGIRMLMNEFLDEDFRPAYLAWVAAVPGEDYYVKMMAAWYFAAALAKQYEASVVYLEARKLDPWTHKKAIQKAIESCRVSEAHKAYLKTLK